MSKTLKPKNIKAIEENDYNSKFDIDCLCEYYHFKKVSVNRHFSVYVNGYTLITAKTSKTIRNRKSFDKDGNLKFSKSVKNEHTFAMHKFDTESSMYYEVYKTNKFDNLVDIISKCMQYSSTFFGTDYDMFLSGFEFITLGIVE